MFAIDDTAPFTATLDTKSLGSGRHNDHRDRGDGTYTVQQELTPTFAFRPNIVFLLTDDLDQMTTQYLDAMPHLRSLISDTGMTFSNMFVNNADCCPSRATFLTGRYPHNTGVFDNTPPDGGFQAFAASAEHDTIATRLQAQGLHDVADREVLQRLRREKGRRPPGLERLVRDERAVHVHGLQLRRERQRGGAFVRCDAGRLLDRRARESRR